MSDERPFTLDESGNLCASGSILLHAKYAIAPGVWKIDFTCANALYALGFVAGKLHEDDGQKLARAARERVAAAKADLLPLDAEEAALEREALERGRKPR